ncbi:dTDP-4-dehydrorhamnose reductase [Palleronia abyssalis]|uniref:dTDP-4-dehydrorhamnose reductase n=1 Tax=Palleronia abyssalis TaxID=1501240 RepID=A0A2R8BUV0_9RHOB|nr:dTDP-4-dehydrorhamnose reductase [Palleronia abyssalis]SPJ23905.1 dTDP-4-dehydrorhamnose reductase [Palleronia abyssalis]
MRILVFGKTGQVASALGGNRGVITLDRDAADLTDPAACAAAVHAHRPDAVINAAAHTAVDRAEGEEHLATLVNGAAPGAIAAACAELGVPMVQLSTDYVFDGSGTAPRAPAEPFAPVNAYGRSKLVGERLVRDSGAAHAVLRTSWVFSGRGPNFVATMLRLSETRNTVDVVDDQIGGPTPAEDIAQACLVIAARLARDPGMSGTYHLSGAPDISWCGFAQAIFATAGRRVRVRPVATADFPTPAARPSNSRLDCTSLSRSFGIARPDWRDALPGAIAALCQSERQP